MKKMLFGFIAIVLISNYSFSSSTIDEKNNVISFLNSYYSSYNLGKSIETIVNNKSIIVSEVLDKDSKTINGYIAVNKDNNELLYFVDYLRNTKEIKAIDFFNNQTNIINLKKDNTFDNFIKIDLLKEIQKINFETAEVYRFWGESCGGSWTLPTGESYRTCCYYVFWINTGCEIEVTAK